MKTTVALAGCGWLANIALIVLCVEVCQGRHSDLPLADLTSEIVSYEKDKGFFPAVASNWKLVREQGFLDGLKTGSSLKWEKEGAYEILRAEEGDLRYLLLGDGFALVESRDSRSSVSIYHSKYTSGIIRLCE